MTDTAPIRLFPELFSIKDFVIKEHPIYHPDSRQYSLYWEEQERYCVEGKWGLDGDLWRYCPGNLYYYVNFTVIEDEDDNGKSTDVRRPLLRDIDWYIMYGWLTCRGFSGFSEDEEFTCSKIVYKLENKIPITPEEKIRLPKLQFLKKQDGSYKTYKEPRQYLYDKCNVPKGLPIYDNDATNLFLLAARGLGKSFITANGILGHEFNFFGKKYYNEYLSDKVRGPELVVGAALQAKSTDLLSKFELTQEYHKSNNGAWASGDDFIPGFFYRNTEGTLTPNTKNIYKHAYRVKENGVEKKKGTGTSVKHVSYTIENPQAAVGTRPTVMVIEEIGLLENIVDVIGSNEYCQKRKTKFGSSIYLGTGGNIDKIVGCKQVFENPSEYNVLPYKDLWEDRTTDIGMFIPAYYGNSIFLDENGNTDIEAANAQEMYERKIKENAKNSMSLDNYKMGKPLYPSEMFLSRASFIFPTVLLRERELELDVKKEWEKNASIGDLVWGDTNKKSVYWEEDLSPARKSKPITLLNIDNHKTDLTGKIVVYEHPDINTPNPTHVNSLYKIVYDPIKDEESGTSLASIIVYKGYTEGFNYGLQNTIVAEWIGRYNQINDVHLIAIKMAMYYNSKILFENNLPNFMVFARENGYYHMLQRTPWDAIKDSIKDPSKKYEVGVAMNKILSIHCEQLIRQWLLDPFLKLENGRMLTNTHNLYSLRLIRELAAYTRTNNFDHLSSFKILMLWLLQDRKKVYTQDDLKEYSKEKELSDYRVHNTIMETNDYTNWYKY